MKVAERRAERAAESVGIEAKQQAGNVDLVTEAARVAPVAGERKAVASFGLQPEGRLRRAVRH